MKIIIILLVLIIQVNCWADESIEKINTETEKIILKLKENHHNNNKWDLYRTSGIGTYYLWKAVAIYNDNTFGGVIAFPIFIEFASLHIGFALYEYFGKKIRINNIYSKFNSIENFYEKEEYILKEIRDLNSSFTTPRQVCGILQLIIVESLIESFSEGDFCEFKDYSLLILVTVHSIDGLIRLFEITEEEKAYNRILENQIQLGIQPDGFSIKYSF